jgi:transglutaminase-like putative cysteine protease
MPVYTITYNSCNKYSEKVNEAILELLIIPETTRSQTVLDFSMDVYPAMKPSYGKNIFGFETIRFKFKKFYSDVRFEFTFTVKKEEDFAWGYIPFSVEEERKILFSEDFMIDNYIYLNPTELTTLPNHFGCPLLAPYESISDFIQRINKFCHLYICYDSEIIDPHRPLEQTILGKRGVCQDYSHLMLAILRKNNIPARYVSGYLNLGSKIVGTGAVHAWVQAFVPGLGWLGTDPTNDLMEDHHFIKIAHGIDYHDCTTMKGIIKSAGTNSTDYHVLVSEQNKGNNQ